MAPFPAGNLGGPSTRAWPPECRSQRRSEKAQTIYANYLEKSDKAKLALFQEAAAWAVSAAARRRRMRNAHYLYAFALGRYGRAFRS
jgi:hypothetical protein